MAFVTKRTFIAGSMAVAAAACLLITGCPAGTRESVSQDSPRYTAYYDCDPQLPFAYITIDQDTGSRRALLMTKDERGNPVERFGAIYVARDGHGFVTLLGTNGLPARIITDAGKEVRLDNWGAGSVDVTVADDTGAKSGTVQASLCDEAALQLEQLRELVQVKSADDTGQLALNVMALICNLSGCIVTSVFAVQDGGVHWEMTASAVLTCAATLGDLLMCTSDSAPVISAITLGISALGTAACIAVDASVDPGTTIGTGYVTITIAEATGLLFSFISAVISPASTPPEMPVRIAPLNGTVIDGDAVTLEWNAVDGCIGYYVGVYSTNASWDYLYECYTHSTSLTIPDLPEEIAEYAWTIYAYDGQQMSARRAYWYFSLDGASDYSEGDGTYNDALEIPVLRSPDDEASIEGTSVTLSWNGVSNADSYECEVWTTEYVDNDFSFPFFQFHQRLKGTSQTLQTLPAPYDFHWNVKAWNDDGHGDSSEYRTFYTQ